MASKHRKQYAAFNQAITIARKHQDNVIIHRPDDTIRVISAISKAQFKA